ncbi:unnamed protein product [Urochloa decumbens]|uniref:Late embryogenesis abundant protein LEA-2 subgroup domain-containing protein n=1 Tax=Urochloa decumbens TaxID=240449 RepID=A0ABC8WIU3_9POAL
MESPPRRRSRGCLRTSLEVGKGLVACLLGLFQCAWQCVEFWTPLTVIVLLLWLIYLPDRFHPHVDSAVLAALQLEAPANATVVQPAQLRYDLAVDLSFRNSHRRNTIRYLDVGATALYNGTKLGPADDALPAPFRQGPKNTTVLHPAFRGAVPIDSGVAAELGRELAAGTVHVGVTVELTLMYKVWLAKEVFFYKYDCWLWFPPPANAAPAVFNAGTQCWAA